MIQQFLAVALGGALGSCLRFGVARLVPTPDQGLPWATVLVNLVGCLLIGALFGWSVRRGGLEPTVQALLITGFLGGFTTFSAFGLETVQLARAGRELAALIYVVVQVFGGLAAVVLGAWLGRQGW